MDRVRNISKSMISYLKRTQEYKEFLLRETKEFEQGKRHLANIMGIEANEMTQEDVDSAIKYLFPSGLFDKRAQPLMKHPDLLFKARKDAQFDLSGRPHHYLFYTVHPNYYESLSDISKTIRELNKHEDTQFAKGILNAPEGSSFSLVGRAWLSHDEIKGMLLESIHDSDYDYLIRCLNHLVGHPYSARASKLLQKFSKPVRAKSLNIQLPEILRDEETGEIYTEVIDQQREHELRVRIVLNGSGKFDYDGFNILFFEAPYMRQSIYDPLRLTGMIDNVDIKATSLRIPRIEGQGAIASIIRRALARSLAAYVDSEMSERLRYAGLLTRDTRRAERKKPGQEGARRKFTWKRR